MAMFSATEVAEELGIVLPTLLYWVGNGEIEKPEFQQGKRMFFTAAQITKIKKSLAYAVLLRKQARRAARNCEALTEKGTA